jgi:hypothetical protein
VEAVLLDVGENHVELLERDPLERGDLDRLLAGAPRVERPPGVGGLRVVATDPTPPAPAE